MPSPLRGRRAREATESASLRGTQWEREGGHTARAAASGMTTRRERSAFAAPALASARASVASRQRRGVRDVAGGRVLERESARVDERARVVEQERLQARCGA